MRWVLAVLFFVLLALFSWSRGPACSDIVTASSAASDENYFGKILGAISEAEKFRAYPYPDRGHWSIGYGRNLTARGVSRPEAWLLMENDVLDVTRELDEHLPWWQGLNAPRRAALVEMGYNLGVGGLRSFERMLDALKRGEFQRAEAEALDSRWHKQVGNRAKRIARQLRTGEWQSTGYIGRVLDEIERTLRLRQ